MRRVVVFFVGCLLALPGVAQLGTWTGTGVAVASGSEVRPATHTHHQQLTPAGQLGVLLAAGQKHTASTTVQMGEILGVAAPGSGEIIRVHSAWNAARHLEADAVTIDIGRLGEDLPSERVASTIDVSKDGSTWIKATTAGAKWTYERLPAPAETSDDLLSGLLKLTGNHVKVKRVSSSRTGSKWALSYTASDLQSVEALGAQLAVRTSRLPAADRSLLSGERLRVNELQLTLDGAGRVTDLRLGGVLVESPDDAAARHQPYPSGGIKGVVLLHLAFTYGGHLAISPPPSADVVNPRRPLR